MSELLRSAWDGLKSHKLRSGLTTLGVIFGVAAVIGMASIGEGARREALKQIDLMGATNIVIDEERPEKGEEHDEAVAKNPDGLTLKDAEAIRELIPEAVEVIPVRLVEDWTVWAGDLKGQMNLIASTPELFKLNRITVAAGRGLSRLDDRDAQRVCVLGWGAKRELFPIESAIGETVKVGNLLFTVVGIAERRWSGGDIKGLDLRDFNRDIYFPLGTAMKRFPPLPTLSELNQIIVQFSGVDRLSQYAGLIERIMLRRHRNIEDFSVTVPIELLRQHQQTQRIFNIVMGAIASISLVVGGIGIMNIMLASVLERTREIGIRRAVGARQRDIARQFLAEAVLLSLLGGIVGVLLGVLLAQGISSYAGWETAVSGWAILMAVGVSAGVGIVFGYLPARRAAKMDPITALRFE